MKNIINNMVGFSNLTAVEQLYTDSGTIYLNPYTKQERYIELINLRNWLYVISDWYKIHNIYNKYNSKIKQHIRNGYQN